MSFTRYYHRSHDPDSLSNDTVQSIFEDREGKLWIGTLDGALMVNPGGLYGWRDRSLALMNVEPNGLRAQLVYIDPPRQPRDSRLVARILSHGR